MRALKRPPRGWTAARWSRRTWGEWLGESISNGLLFCVVICMLSAMTVSVWASAIMVIHDVVTFYQNF